jgi:hypothetical protein
MTAACSVAFGAIKLESVASCWLGMHVAACKHRSPVLSPVCLLARHMTLPSSGGAAPFAPLDHPRPRMQASRWRYAALRKGTLCISQPQASHGCRACCCRCLQQWSSCSVTLQLGSDALHI